MAAPPQRARRLASIRQLYRFAYEEGLRADNPAIQIKGPARVRTLPKTLSMEDVTRLFSYCSSDYFETTFKVLRGVTQWDALWPL